jgi:hypothetical protein
VLGAYRERPAVEPLPAEREKALHYGVGPSGSPLVRA